MRYRLFYFLCIFFLILPNSCTHSTDLQLIKSANYAHYNLATIGLKSFTCKIEVKELNHDLDEIRNQLPKDHPMATANNIQFLAMIKDNGDIDLKPLLYFRLGYKKFDNALEHAVNGAEKIIDSFLRSWSGLTFEPIFPEIGRNYKVERDSKYYYITYMDKLMPISAKLTNNLKLVEIFAKESFGETRAEIKFKDTKNGFLLERYHMFLSNGPFETIADINYQKIEGFFLPETVNILNKMESGNQNITLLFSDYKLNR